MFGVTIDVFRGHLLPMLPPAQIAALGAMSPRVLARVWDKLFELRTLARFAHMQRCAAVTSPEMAEQFLRDSWHRDWLMLNATVIRRDWLSMNPDADEPDTDDETPVPDGLDSFDF